MIKNKMSLLGITLCMCGLVVAVAARADVRQDIPAEAEDQFGSVLERAAKDYMDGEYGRALEGFTAAIELNPSSPTPRYNRGTVFFAKREFEKAILDFDEAIRLSPGFANAYMNRGIAYSSLGRLDEALRDLDSAVRLNPKSGDIYFNRAIVNVRRRNNIGAFRDYEAAIKLDDDRDEARAIRIRLLKLLGRGVPAEVPDGIVVSQTTLSSINPLRMGWEIEHGRRIEHILRLIDDSCVAVGDDISELSNLALRRKWDAVPADQLAKRNTDMAELKGGWTFSDRFGTYAVIQSVVPTDRGTSVCSITAGLGSSHLLEDLRTGFESRFAVSASEIVERPGQTITRYWLPRAGTSEAKASLVASAASSSFTFRIIIRKTPQQEGGQ